jgi:hypothetical protein
MTKENQELMLHAQQTPQTNNSVFSNVTMFDQAQRFAQALCKSDIVPKAYQGNIPNTLVALEMANRMGESPLMVMQNLDIIHGKPSFSSKFVIGRLNTCGRFTPLRFKYEGTGDKRSCVAYAQDMRTGDALEGTAVTIEMAKKEGWYAKAGSKWQTMPDHMLMYRAGTFFGRMYAPELTLGMQTTEELYDIGPSENVHNRGVVAAIDDLNESITKHSDAGRTANLTSKAVEPKAELEVQTIPIADSTSLNDEDMI